MSAIPSGYEDLFNDDSQNTFAVIATITPNEIPVTTPIWFLANEQTIVFSASLNSIKYHNIQHNPNVSLCILKEDNHVRYVEIRGKVTNITREGWGDFSHRIKRKYPGGDEPSEIAPENMTIFVVSIEKAFGFDYS